MSRKKKIMLLAICGCIAGLDVCPVNAAVDCYLQNVTSDVCMYNKPEDGAAYLCTIRAGEKVYNYGIDFEEGNSDYDHVYRIKTKKHGYVNHHHW